MRRSLNQLGVYCTYNIDGCNWRGELGELQAHLDKTDHSSELLQYEYASRYIHNRDLYFTRLLIMAITQEFIADLLTIS